jgi:glutamate synthase (NADPH/NADH) small chain
MEMKNHEALRCLLCKKPLCSEACPVSTPVPQCMQLYRNGELDEAGRILFENNPMSAVTSLICDWNRLCYGHCVLNRRGVPVRWYEIEQEISGEYLKKARINVPAETGKSVAIVGSGPAGITAAIKLREKGVRVEIYDEETRPGGVPRYGIPEFRLDKTILNRYERILFEAGVTFHGGVQIGKDIMLSELQEKFDAVFVAAGADIPRKLDIPGEEGNPHVIYSLDFLKDPSAYTLGSKVLVIGGGNVTMDAARTAVRMGCDTTIVYRKTFENMPANYREVEEAKFDGVKFELFQVPVAIEGNEAVVVNCENYEDENGKIRTRTLEGTEHRMKFDSMLVSISANVDYNVFNGTSPQLDAKGRVVVGDDMQTIPGVFAAGDFVSGPSTVVDSVASAKKAVESILKYIGVGSEGKE